MERDSDTYITIVKPVEGILFKDRGSKFFGYAYPITSESEVKTHIDQLKKEHHNARHWCYGYQLGMDYSQFRANDDGEPSNSAGMPIYGQIKSFDLTQVLVVVVRYFGGTKLGVGGLINAYKTTAQWTLQEAKLISKTIDRHFLLTFDYPEMNVVMRIIKEQQLQIVKQESALDCRFEIAVRQQESDRIFKLFENTYKVKIKAL